MLVQEGERLGMKDQWPMNGAEDLIMYEVERVRIR